MICIDPKNRDNFDKRQWVRLINSLSGPKSANLVGTVSKDGKTNLSMVSSAFHLGAQPPLMGYVSRPHSNQHPRHTLMNIEETGFYTINHVDSSFLKQAHQTSARYKRDQSEFEMCDLDEEYLDSFAAPYVAPSKLKLGLRLIEIVPIKQNNTDLVIGEIEKIHLSSDCLREDGSVDIAKAGSVAVTGLDEYHQLSTLFRLSYAKPDQPILEIIESN